MEKKSSETDIHSGDTRFRFMAEAMPEGVFIIENEIVVYANKAAEKLTGYSSIELNKMNLADLAQGEEKEKIINLIHKTGSSGFSDEITVDITTGDGAKRLLGLRYISDGMNSDFKGGFLFASDITESFLADKSLKERELSRFKFIVDAAGEEFYLVRKDGSLAYVNESSAGSLGYSIDELLEIGVPGIDPVFNSEKYKEHFDELKLQKEIPAFETIHIRKDGSMVPKEIKSVFFSFEGEEFVCGFGRDISSRKSFEKALFDEKELLEVTLSTIKEGVIVTDSEGKVVLLNSFAEELTGCSRSEASLRNLHDILPSLRTEKGEPFSVTESLTEFEGDRRKVLIASNPRGGDRILLCSVSSIRKNEDTESGRVYVFMDITEQTNHEKEMNKMHKLESLGLLAGGIAHDFNNILTAIIGNLSLLSFDSDIHPAHKQILDEVETASLRAKELTLQLLTFSRGGSPVKKLSSIESLIKDSVSFVLRGSNTEPVFNFQKNLPPVSVDRGQFSQVIQNLIINADQSMPEGGKVYIRASTVSDHFCNISFEKMGRCILIEIEDRGEGILPEYIDRIYDPYFTTKEDGSGLGLAVAYSIITKHGGRIRVNSKPGQGTVFGIYLPEEDVAVNTFDEKNTSFSYRDYSGAGRILIMDDETSILNVTVKMLSLLGYESVTCLDGREALQLYDDAEKNGRSFDAVIMDLTVPGGIGGKEASERLLKKYPSALIIIASGYSNDPVMADYWKYGIKGRVFKPYTIEDIGSVLHGILDAGKNRT